MPLQLSTDVDSNFVHPGLFAGQPLSAAELAKYGTQTTLDANLPASISDADKVSMTINDKLFAARQNLAAWSATSFAINTYVTHLGKVWYASTAAISTDVPGTAALWKQTQAPYL